MEHTLNLAKRTALAITGIKKVKSSEPNCIIAVLENSMLVITGAGLSVNQLNIADGTLSVTGTVNSVKYSNSVSKKFSFKNIFK
jgi:sporulation protein YabP